MTSRGRGRGGPAGPDRGSSRGAFRGSAGPPRGGGPGGIYSPSGASSSIDSRLTDGSETALIQSFRSLQIRPSNDLPLRPGFGTLGTPVKLRANFFPVKVPRGPLFEYDVAFNPAASQRWAKRRLFQIAEQSPYWVQYGLKDNVAHDHSAKFIAAKKLQQPLSFTIPYFDEDERGPSPDSQVYTLTITFTQSLDISKLNSYLEGQTQYRGYDILPVISALNLVLTAWSNRYTADAGVLVGRNRYFFASAMPPTKLGGGLEAWRGFFTSVRPTHKQLMVNVNVCTTAFYRPGNLAQAMIEYRNHSFGARYSTFTLKVRVETTHLGHRKTVNHISDLTPDTYKFHCDDFGGAEVSVTTYFKRKYGITLRHLDLPLVDLGSQKKSILVPPEVCEILPNQAFKGKLSDENVSMMIKVAANPPNINAGAIIDQGLNLLGFRTGKGPLDAFGISVGREMAVIPGRILPSPGIKYGQGSPHVDDRASWNLRDVKFAKGTQLNNWLVLLLQDNNRDEFESVNDPQLRSTVSSFINTLKACGIQVLRDPTFLQCSLPPKDSRDPIRGKSITTIRASLQSVKSKPELILVILPSTDKHIYNGLKHLCDSFLDVQTVCVQVGKFRKGQPQYFANVALKINMKLNGVNHVLDTTSMKWLHFKPTMIVGIDVTHPSPGNVPGTPSIAAVVASVDNQFAQYPASMEIQESRKEMVSNLDRMLRERLHLYQRTNKKLPDRILIYRDGVSEGQFPAVIAEELPLMHKACRQFDLPKKYEPKITIVICGKRHHTRFYPTDTSGADQKGNPKPGTVVDRGVTAIYDFDFFLQAHGALQGTSRPSHYYVIHDQIGFQADELQTLTNSLSYMFSRATKAVSLVSPAYFADLACERGRCYLHKLLSGITSVNLKLQDADEKVMEEATKLWHQGVSGSQLKDTMYYL